MFFRKIAVLIFVLLVWCYSPVFLPDDYSGLAGERKEMAEIAIESAKTEWEVVLWRYKVTDVVRNNTWWDVSLTGYGFFNIPLKKVEVTIADGRACSGSFRNYFPGADLVAWAMVAIWLLTIVALLLTPVYLIYKVRRR
jgi:hypothetical protein